MDQWYEQDKELYNLEIEAMSRAYPEACMGFLQDKTMYWNVPIHTQHGKWTVLIVYDCDYMQLPRTDFYGIKVYPFEPSYEKMKSIVNNSKVYPNRIPHTYLDQNGKVCLDVITARMVNNRNDRCFTAAKWVSFVVRWYTYFEAGIKDPKIWELFCGK